MAKGDCYAANGRWMIGKDGYQLVHGVAILATDGKPFGHCWIEKGNQVLDFSNGKKVLMNKKKYYELGGIPVKPYKLYKYTYLEMAKKLLQTEHWGPWDLRPPR
tara:strand:- start:8417 stop:8728 length:312 start_codon:yes stop_codon:yes gene_type:complete